MATKAALRALTLAYEGHNTISYPIRLLGAEKKLGCTCLSVGTEAGEDQAAPNVAISVGRALGSVWRFFDFASSPPATATELGEAFAAAEAKAFGVDSLRSCAEGGRARNAGLLMASGPIRSRRPEGLLSRIFAIRGYGRRGLSKKSGVQQHRFTSSLSVFDFDLLRVVGKGAFGKVMLVRKKQGQVIFRVLS